MERVLAARSLPLAFALASLPGCSAIDPQVGPSQESCGAKVAGAGNGSGNAGYPPTPSSGSQASPAAAPWQTCSADAGSPCDDCESKWCCMTRLACYADPVCACADQALDACLDSTEQDGGVPSAGATACWTAFSARGTVEEARVACVRAWCSNPCSGP